MLYRPTSVTKLGKPLYKDCQIFLGRNKMIQLKIILLFLSCPAQSNIPLSCLQGYYSNQTGLSSCRSCPAGHECQHNTNT